VIYSGIAKPLPPFIDCVESEGIIESGSRQITYQ